MLNWRKLFPVLLAFTLTAALSLSAAAASPAPTTSPGPGLRPENRRSLNRECVDWCCYRGLMDSYSSASISDPYAPATRAVVAEALCQLDAGPEKRPTGLFAGVERGQAVASGAPERAVTRQELACILYRRAGEPEDWREALGEVLWPPPPVEEMEDREDIDPQARAAVDWAMGTMVVPHYYFSDGESHQYFLPQGDVTKNDLAVVLYRLHLLRPEKYVIDPEEVESIHLALGDANPSARRSITSREEIREFVELLNGLEVISARALPLTSGCGKSFWLKYRDGRFAHFEYSGSMLEYGSITNETEITMLYTVDAPSGFLDDWFASLRQE